MKSGENVTPFMGSVKLIPVHWVGQHQEAAELHLGDFPLTLRGK